MAETATKKAATSTATPNGVAKTDSNLPISLGGKTLSMEEAAEALQSMSVGDKDSNYMEIEPGEERRVLFLGWEQIDGLGDKAGQKVPACSFFVTSENSKDGKKQINADAVIVSYFEKQTPGVARKIVCTGTTKSKGGFEYKKFDFFELNAKK